MNPRIIFVGLSLLASLMCMGCSRPSEASRQNRRLVDAALTAVTMKNSKELDKCRKLIGERRGAGNLSETNHAKIVALIDLAASGQWKVAEDGFYEFRKSEPFP